MKLACSVCGAIKEPEEFYRRQKSKTGRMGYCKECAHLKLMKLEEKDPIRFRTNIMASTILKRTKLRKDSSMHMSSYIRNNVKCKLGDTTKEISDILYELFYDDIATLIAQEKTPSVDRIDSKGDYEIGNIRVIDNYINSADGFRSANQERKKPVRAYFKNGNIKEYESISEAERENNLQNVVSKLIFSKGRSRKDEIFFEYSSNELNDYDNLLKNYLIDINKKRSGKTNALTNKGSSVYIEINGEINNIKNWAKKLGFSQAAFQDRLKKYRNDPAKLLKPPKKKQAVQSGVRGISWSESMGKWKIFHKGKHLGYRGTIEEAIELKNLYKESY